MRRTLGVVVVAGALFLVSCSSSPPISVSCSEGQTACGEICSALAVDDKNCGSCGTACDENSACANGACHPRDCPQTDCDPSSVCFDSACVDKTCVGVICPTGTSCSQGLCVCAGGRMTCNGACVDPKLDDANCGACGNACGANESCANGACLPDDCVGGASCDPLSVCYQGDCTERACVGVVCSSGQQCRAGLCACGEGERICNGVCTDTRVDDGNCGGCGNVCTGGSKCGGGECISQQCGSQQCDPLSVCFQGNCVQAACVGVSCNGGKVCSNGFCACPTGKTDCGGTCVDTKSDANHCGVCGKACASTEACVNGQCGSTACAVGQTMCAGSCVDVQTNPDHCSACGAACGGGRNCVGGACVCPSGLTFCGGACVNLQTDPDNCGVCGRDCGTGTCAAGVCSCPSGETLCSGVCRATGSDSNNCGQCGRVCTNGQVCISSNCACPAGQTLCNGACVDTSNDVLRCGSCTTVCNSGQFCNNGVCTAPFTCQSNFNAGPSDCPVFPLNRSQCGAPTTVASQTFTGSTTGNNIPIWYPFPIASNEQVTVNATLSAPSSPSGANVRVALTNDAGTDLESIYQTAPQTGSSLATLVLPGSLQGCAQPTQLLVFNNIGGTSNHTLVADRQSMSGRFNVGSLTAADAGVLVTGTSGRICDLVCGSVALGCPGANRQYFQLTIPARKAVVIEGAFFVNDSGGAIFEVFALNAQGGQICNPISAVGNTTPAFAKARIVNNTAADQPVTIYVNLRATGENNAQFHLAVGVEP